MIACAMVLCIDVACLGMGISVEMAATEGMALVELRSFLNGSLSNE